MTVAESTFWRVTQPFDVKCGAEAQEEGLRRRW